ncbi:acyltransferase [Burkholderiaceae bacterium DAT-1]|nr:acyltransferase [Burkholderiaceae bacterium DAT-1]
MSSNTSTRNHGIDLLRGLSILFVVIHHLALPFRLPLKESPLGLLLGKRLSDAISFHGWESVFIFFIISGFLITSRVMERDGGLADINWRQFYIQRISRITPLLLALLGLLSILHLVGVPNFVVGESGQTLGGALFSAVTFHLNWYEGRTNMWLPPAWDVLWSLSVEEVFYLAFPLLCLLMPRWLLIGGLIALVLSMPFTHGAIEAEVWREKAYLPGMSAIALGVLCALVFARWPVVSRAFARCIAIMGGGLLINVFVFDDVAWRIFGEQYNYLLLSAGGMLVLASAWLRPERVPGLGWLASMGKASYGIYLTHMLIVIPVVETYRYYLGKDMQWTCWVYLPALLACVWLGKVVESGLGEPARKWVIRRLGS